MELIWFGNDWFAENRTSSHHMARRMGAQFPVLYVEVPGLRAPSANARDFGKVISKLRMMFEPPQQVGPHLWRMTLPQIPFRRTAALRALNRAISTYFVRKAIKKLGFQNTAAWFHIPHAGFLAKHLGEKLTIYYCVDEFSKIPGVDEQAVKSLDNNLTRAADIVFTCNQPLLEDRKALNPNISVSPHGVDAELFGLAADPATEIPAELKDLPRPIIGSWGLLDSRVDLTIVEYIAKTHPEWTVVMIGRVATDISGLAGLPNVHFPGIKPYNDLPKWAKAIDVCILPYVQTELIIQSSPLKLREYLAAGKPLVTIPLPETGTLGDQLMYATDGPGFVAKIEEALATNSPELVRLRQESVAGNSWDATFENALAKVQAEWVKRGN